MAIGGNVIERSDEAIIGWRSWNLSDDASAPRLLPAGSGVDDAWQPLRAMTARCGVPSILKLGRRVLDKKRSEVTLEELTTEMAGGQELAELSHELKR